MKNIVETKKNIVESLEELKVSDSEKSLSNKGKGKIFKEGRKVKSIPEKKLKSKVKLIVIQLHPEVWKKFKQKVFEEESTMQEALITFIKEKTK